MFAKQHNGGAQSGVAAALEGGPFVTTPGGKDAIGWEPRVRTVED